MQIDELMHENSLLVDEVNRLTTETENMRSRPHTAKGVQTSPLTEEEGTRAEPGSREEMPEWKGATGDGQAGGVSSKVCVVVFCVGVAPKVCNVLFLFCDNNAPITRVEKEAKVGLVHVTFTHKQYPLDALHGCGCAEHCVRRWW